MRERLECLSLCLRVIKKSRFLSWSRSASSLVRTRIFESGYHTKKALESDKEKINWEILHQACVGTCCCLCHNWTFESDLCLQVWCIEDMISILAGLQPAFCSGCKLSQLCLEFPLKIAVWIYNTANLLFSTLFLVLVLECVWKVSFIWHFGYKNHNFMILLIEIIKTSQTTKKLYS